MTKTAILSDIHGNSTALEAVLDDIRAQGCSRIFFLGDIVNGWDPSLCISMLRQFENLQSIKGNAEHYVLTPDLDNYPRKDDPMYRDLILLIRWWHTHLTVSDLGYIQELPDFLMVNDWWLIILCVLSEGGWLLVPSGLVSMFRSYIEHMFLSRVKKCTVLVQKLNRKGVASCGLRVASGWDADENR